MNAKYIKLFLFQKKTKTAFVIPQLNVKHHYNAEIITAFAAIKITGMVSFVREVRIIIY